MGTDGGKAGVPKGWFGSLWFILLHCIPNCQNLIATSTGKRNDDEGGNEFISRVHEWPSAHGEVIYVASNYFPCLLQYVPTKGTILGMALMHKRTVPCSGIATLVLLSYIMYMEYSQSIVKYTHLVV